MNSASNPRACCPALTLAPFCLSCLLSAAACNLDDGFNDLADNLLDPDAKRIDTPGRQLVTGRYRALDLDATFGEGARVLAIREGAASDTLAILPFEGGRGCEVGPAASYTRLSSLIDLGVRPLVGFLAEDTPSRRSTLRFVDFDCAEPIAPILDAPLPSVTFPQSIPSGFVLLAGDGLVHHIDVVRRKSSVITQDVTSGRTANDRLWLLEGQRLTQRDSSFQLLESYGQNVTEFQLAPSLGAPDGVAYIDDGSLMLIGADGIPEVIAEDSCRPTSAPNGALAFFSPCATRKLNLLVPSSLLPATEGAWAVLSFGEQVVRPDLVQIMLHAEGLAVAYLAAAEPNANAGDLWFARSAEDTERVARQVTSIKGEWLADWDGVRGRLIRLDVDADDEQGIRLVGVQELANGVAQIPGGTALASIGVLANFDGQTGDLVRVVRQSGGFGQELIAGGVPIQSYAVSAEGDVAFLAESDGTEGTLLMRSSSATVTAVGARALVNTARFFVEPQALGYLVDARADGTTTLRVRLLDADLDQDIATHVREYAGIAWPTRGILYIVDHAERGGIWFARAL